MKLGPEFREWVKKQQEKIAEIEKEPDVGLFFLKESQIKQAYDWISNHDCSISLDENGQKKTGAIGGEITWCFTPTTIGDVQKVKCACGKEIDITLYDLW